MDFQLKDTDSPRRVALFVGVDEYEDGSIHPLRGAVADATALRDFADTHGMFDSEPTLLVNPTVSDVQREVNRITRGLPRGSLFFFYFSGHGVEQDGGHQHHLCCHDTYRAGGKNVNPAYAVNLLADNFFGLHRVLVLDACRSPLEVSKGGGTRRTGSAETRKKIEIMCADVGKADRESGGKAGSLTVLHACDPGKTAEELEDSGGNVHGLFSWALLQELEDAAANHETVEVDTQLQNRLESRMEKIAEVSGGVAGEQRPGLSTSGPTQVLFESRFDAAPYVNWVSGLSKVWTLKSGAAGKIISMLHASGRDPVRVACVETVRHFGDAAIAAGGSAPTDALAVKILEGLCDKPEPKTVVVEKPAPLPAAGVPAKAVLLSKSDKQALQSVLGLCSPTWKGRAKGRSVADALENAATVEEAVSVLDGMAFSAMREFGEGNNAMARTYGAGRMPQYPSRCATPFLELNDCFRFERDLHLWDDEACPLSPLVRDALRRALEAAKLFTR